MLFTGIAMLLFMMRIVMLLFMMPSSICISIITNLAISLPHKNALRTAIITSPSKCIPVHNLDDITIA